MVIDLFVKYCVNHCIVSPAEIPLLRYCLEKRVYTFVFSIPIIIFCAYISDVFTAATFYLSFIYLRKITNGFHSTTAIHCFFCSVGVIILLFKVVHPNLTPLVIFILTVLSFLLIWRFAPYNHPNMHLSYDEIKACQKKSRERICLLIVLMQIISLCFGIAYIKGIVLGIFLDASLLSISYIIRNWRKAHGKDSEKKYRSDSA